MTFAVGDRVIVLPDNYYDDHRSYDGIRTGSWHNVTVAGHYGHVTKANYHYATELGYGLIQVRLQGRTTGDHTPMKDWPSPLVFKSYEIQHID